MASWFQGFGLESKWEWVYLRTCPHSIRFSLALFTLFSDLECSSLTLNVVGSSAISVSLLSLISHGCRSICSLYSFGVDEVRRYFFRWIDLLRPFFSSKPSLPPHGTWFSMEEKWVFKSTTRLTSWVKKERQVYISHGKFWTHNQLQFLNWIRYQNYNFLAATILFFYLMIIMNLCNLQLSITKNFTTSWSKSTTFWHNKKVLRSIFFL